MTLLELELHRRTIAEQEPELALELEIMLEKPITRGVSLVSR